MKIIVVGAKGFIGAKCMAYFGALGHEVVGADIHAGDGRYLQVDAQDPDFEPLLETHSDALVCINASGSAHVGFSFEEPHQDFNLNVANVCKLISAIKKYSPQCKFINLSSAAVYGNPNYLPVDEAHPMNPLSPYGFHKFQSELICKEYAQYFGVSTCSLRIFSAYGPGLKKQLFWDVYQKSLRGAIELFGTGEESRDFIYIDDLVYAIDCVIQRSVFKGETINIASGTETTIKDATNELVAYLSPNIGVTFNQQVKEGDPKNWRANIDQLKALGFVSNVSFSAGIKQYAAWVKDLE